MCLGIPGELIEIEPSDDLGSGDGESLGRRGLVSFGGARKSICLDFVPEAVVGDYVIVHAGFALSQVDPVEARAIFDLLDQVDPSQRTWTAPSSSFERGVDS